MTLEQIKNRQYLINDALYALLQNTRGVLFSIVGEGQEISQDDKDIIPSPSGFLQEITAAQDATERLIKSIEGCNILLVNNTYSPVEEIQSKS